MPEMERVGILKDLGCRLILKLLNYLWYNLQTSLATPTVIVGVNSDFGFVDLVSPHSGQGSHLAWQAMRQRDRETEMDVGTGEVFMCLLQQPQFANTCCIQDAK